MESQATVKGHRLAVLCGAIVAIVWIAWSAASAEPARGVVVAVWDGRGPCAVASDYDRGWCYAKYFGVEDPEDCWFEDESEEFSAGCEAYVGEPREP